MSKFPYTECEATQARLTVLPTPDGDIREPGSWQQVTGEEPAQHTKDRKRQSSIISGELESGTLTLSLAPERIDWLLSAPDVDPALAFSPMAPMIDVFDQFSQLAERWLSAGNIPPISRIAFGAAVTHPESDHDTAYRRLPDYIPVRVDPSWQDFIFQINVPRDLAHDDHGPKSLNRLGRWSVQLQTTGTLMRGSEGFIGGEPEGTSMPSAWISI